MGDARAIPEIDVVTLIIGSPKVQPHDNAPLAGVVRVRKATACAAAYRLRAVARADTGAIGHRLAQLRELEHWDV